MKLQDYIHYYIGCKLQRLTKSGEIDHVKMDAYEYYRISQESYPYSIKPILRKLEDITETEMIGLLQSMTPADMKDKPTDEDYDLEMFYNDDGLMVDGDIAVGANYSCRCFEGQIGVKKCGSIVLFDEVKDITSDELTNTPMAFHYLLKQGFDLFGLVDAGLSIHSKTLKQ